jgi:hypothetical protein
MKEWRWLISGTVLLGCAFIWAVQSNQISSQPDIGYKALLGDLDGDSDMDALLITGAGVSRPAISIWINQGGLQGNTQGKFSTSIQHLGEPDPRSAALGDLDNDGDLDVLIGKASGFEVYINNGGPQGGWQGNFQQQGSQSVLNEGDHVWQIELGDLDDDGDLDALIGLCCAGTASYSAWLNAGNGIFTDSGQYLGEAGSRQFALGDLDGDADLDMVMVVQRHSADSDGAPDPGPMDQVWLNDGHGRFSDSGLRLGQGGSHTVALGDLDGDTDLDAFIAGDQTASIWINDGTGRFAMTTQMTGRVAAQAIMLGDLDQDRDLDALLSSGERVEVWMNDGRGTFELSAQRIDLTRYSAVALGDLDGDGDLDLFSGYLDQRYRIWWNDGFGRLGLSWR